MSKLKKIIFEESNKDGGALPVTVTIELTIQEAIWIAEKAGKQTGNSPHHEIYDCLVGDVFNRYWDDGVADAKRLYASDFQTEDAK